MLINGHIYGISSCIVCPVLYYNMNMFDDAGVPYPPHNPDKAWTWDEFVSVAKKLTLEKGGKTTQFGAYGFEGYWWPMVWSNQGEIFTEDYSRCILADDANAQEALQKQLDCASPWSRTRFLLYGEYGMSAAQMLQTGRVAMLVDGSWHCRNYLRWISQGLPHYLYSKFLNFWYCTPPFHLERHQASRTCLAIGQVPFLQGIPD